VSAALRLLACLWLLAAAPALADDSELGRRLYREGLLASGQPVLARVGQGLELRGAEAACVRCHRRSGLGGSEGATAIRPIGARFLFQPLNPPQARMYPGLGESPGTRPAYDEASLDRVLREGIDAAGRPLPGPMPRYRLDPRDAGNLTAYLKTLSAAPAPGVTDGEIHFATVVDAAADPAATQAMLSVLAAYVEGKNASTRLEDQRAVRSGWKMARKYQAYRKWRLHVWTLTGAPASWPAQLAAHYREQPVFALLSGIGAGDWQPVHDFCEGQELPCLFPLVAQPPTRAGHYALYLSRGLALEAEALARHLAGAAGDRLVQVYRPGSPGAEAAAALRRAWPGPARLDDLALAPEQVPDAEFWRRLGQDGAATATRVLWLADADLAGLDASGAPERVYLSASLADPARLPPGTRLTYPYQLPRLLEPRLARLRALPGGPAAAAEHPRIRLDSLFAATQAGEAIAHMVDNFQRDYFIERIEHSLENATLMSAYPHPALGPGQRFASKGCYIVAVDPGATDRLTPVSEWLVP
jgi:hypothetical protein